MKNSNPPSKINQDNIRGNVSFKSVVKGTIKGLILTVLLCIVGAVIFKVFDLTKLLIPSIGWWFSLIGIFFGGISASKNAGGKGLLHGAMTGILFVVILSIINFVVFRSLSFSSLPFKLLIGIVAGIVGGVIGVNL